MISCKREYETIEYFFDEMPAEKKLDFEIHIKKCEHCRAQLDNLQLADTVVKSYQRPQPEGQILRQYRQALNETFGRGKHFSIHLDKLKEKFITRPTIGIRFAEAFAILIIGIFIGKMTFWKTENIQNNVNYESAAVTPTAVEALLLKNYLQEAEMILLDVANLDPVDDHSVILELKKIAEYRRLLQKTLICKEHAEQLNDEKMGDLLNQIEVILLELCNIEQVSLDETFMDLKQQLRDTNLLRTIKNVNQNTI